MRMSKEEGTMIYTELTKKALDTCYKAHVILRGERQ